MVQGAEFSHNDIPFCPTTMTVPPPRLISYEEAKRSKDYEAGVAFYKDDYKFDGLKSGIWVNYVECLRTVCKFRGGVITPDFAMNQDLPDPWKRMNIYRSRAYGFYFVKAGLAVCNNIRWGDPNTWSYCFDGVSKGSMVAVSTHGCIKKSPDRKRYVDGLYEMIKIIEPPAILVYGSCPENIFGEARKMHIKIYVYESEMKRYLGGKNE